IHPLAPRQATEDALLATAAAELRQEGQKLAYVVFPTVVDETEAAPFSRAGFRPITELLYQQRALEDVAAAVPPDELRLVPFQEQPQRFAETLLATYEGTLDCPEMDGLRTLQEILKGHANAGTGGVSRWRLLERDDAAVGVLMLAE